MGDDTPSINAFVEKLTASRQVLVPGVGQVMVAADKRLAVHLDFLRRRANGQQKFWMEKSWPPDAYGWQFLGRAVERLGKAMFSSEWHGFETSVDREIAECDERGFLVSPDQHRRALIYEVEKAIRHREYLERVATKGGVAWQDGASNVIADRKIPLHEIWRVLSTALETIVPARRRLEAVQKALEEALRDGRLSSCLRPIPGGPFSEPRPETDWNIGGAWYRFALCQMHPVLPFGQTSHGEGYEWIFVNAGEMDALCRSRSFVPPTEVGHRQRKLMGEIVGSIIESPRSNPTTSDGRTMGRDYWIDRGRNEFGLTKSDATDAWNKALEKADAAEPQHTWRNLGRRPAEPKQSGEG